MAYHPEDNGVFCATCGQEQEPGTRFCPNCGAAVDPAAAGMIPQSGPAYDIHRPVSNYLVQAILVTIFCCVPTGIIAIVYAAQVNGKLAAGDYAGAASVSSNAKTWCWVSFALGIVVGISGSLVILAGG